MKIILSCNTTILLPRIQRKELELLQMISVLFATNPMIFFTGVSYKDVGGNSPLLVRRHFYESNIKIPILAGVGNKREIKKQKVAVKKRKLEQAAASGRRKKHKI